MVTADTLQQAREQYMHQGWREAYERFRAADADARLDPEDLEKLGVCAHMLGNEAERDQLWERAHHEFLNCGSAEAAARCAFRIGFELLNRGMVAQGSGWLSRARRVIEDSGQDSVVLGLLLIPEAIRSLRDDAARGYELFTQALAIGKRFRDTDLLVIARHGQGRALIRMGRTAEGVALLDEAMIAVTAGELSPLVVGDIYCSVIDACNEIFDMRRAHEWTMALTRWCERQADGIPYRGSCLVRRAEILQLHGSWGDALTEAERACQHLLVPPPKPAAGFASYQRGELHRLRGEFAKAEEAYRQASELGRKPQPGLALLRLAQGATDAALASIRGVVDESRAANPRARALSACIEIMLATGDATAARGAAAELRAIAGVVDAPYLRALASHHEAAILLAEGEAHAAITALRDALDVWREIEAPYEEARSRELMAAAARRLGDTDTAALDLEAARRTFERLGAVTDAARVRSAVRQPDDARGHGPLTSREREVIALIATGKTNRAIADALGLSEKTVARHVSNIFTKLGLSSRAAATAYAFQHRLV